MSNFNVAFLCCAGTGTLLVQMALLFFPDNWWTGSDSGNWMVLGCLVIGAVLTLVGTTLYAIGKGYRWFLGLLGLLTPMGIVVLAALEDKGSFSGKESG